MAAGEKHLSPGDASMKILWSCLELHHFQLMTKGQDPAENKKLLWDQVDGITELKQLDPRSCRTPTVHLK